MNDQENCFICRKHRGVELIPGGAVYEDDLFYSGHSWSVSDQESPYLGSYIVEPKRHIPTWAELNDAEAVGIGKVIRDVSKALKEGVSAEHVYVFVIGHHIPHLHVWVVPRYPDTPREFWGLELFEWPQRSIGDREAIEKMSDNIRSIIG
jgi:histidine triad (HIT) family protein